MSTFGDFALVRAVPSYGGAEVVRARRMRGAAPGPAAHLALYGKAPVESRLIAAAEAVALGPHERVARIHEVGRCAGSLYAVADPLEGLDLRSLLEHERARRGAPEVALGVAVALELAHIASELMDKDVWAGARGAGISSLFAAGLRLDAIVLRADGVALRPLAGAADDAARPTPYRAPEMGQRYAPASTSTDVFAIAQVLRAICAGDVDAASAPRLGPSTAGVAPLLAGGLATAVDERLGLQRLLEELARLLLELSGERRAGTVIARALAGPYRSIVPAAPPDPPPAAAQARAADPTPTVVVWPPEPEDDARTLQGIPAFALASRSSDQGAVERVFTEEGEATPAAPTAVRLQIGSAGAFADEPTQKMPAQTGSAPPPRRSASDPPWISASEVEPLDEQGRRPAAAPAAIPSEVESGPTIEMRSPFDDDKTES